MRSRGDGGGRDMFKWRGQGAGAGRASAPSSSASVTSVILPVRSKEMSSESNTQQQGVIGIRLNQRQSRKTAIMADGGQKVKSAHRGKGRGGRGGGVYEVYNLVCWWLTKSTWKADSVILGRGNHPFQLRQSRDSTTNTDHVLVRLHALKHTQKKHTCV